MSLHYQWFIRSVPIGKNIQLTINGGDIYLMSEKAVGTDWKLSTKPTLRHAAGSDSFAINPIKKRINQDGSLKKPKEEKSDKNYKLVEDQLNIKTSKNINGIAITFTDQAYLFYEKIKDTDSDKDEENEEASVISEISEDISREESQESIASSTTEEVNKCTSEKIENVKN